MRAIPKVDPALFQTCADGIDEASKTLLHGDFCDLMAGVVMSKVHGDQGLALAILKRISALIVCMSSDPAIVAMFRGPNPAVIPAELVHAAAVAPLRENDKFDPNVIRRTALSISEPRGRA